MCRLVIVWAILGLLLRSSPALARPPDFSPLIEHHDVRLTLRGIAQLRVGYVFRVFWAALHVGENHPTDDVLDDVPTRLEIVYLRAIRASDLIRAGDDALRRQVAPDEIERLQPLLDAINRLYQDVRAGDRYTLTYLPAWGCELALNGRTLGRIEGANFASAYFGIWLDPRTPNKEILSNVVDGSVMSWSFW